ncbi:MAG: nucleoside/nucleotide kinase family protein [Lachnospiraceae bacterium]|nr:nucleoside/nucleotide kinase family protein [Lachnospiraceae bacterium]MDY4970335.1 nucleoside/nucleotide kinase family protein [Lachnospiraceae bacterium]
MKREYTYDVNGFQTTVFYEDETVEQIFLPLLRKWDHIQKKLQRRVIIFLSAPPGTGKTTAAQFLEYLSKREKDIQEIQAIGLDGFHYHQDYILTHEVYRDGKAVPMKDVKGCPETFDIEKLKAKISELKEGDVKWPIYDRNIHDVVEDAATVTKQIILLEGNWLLSSEKPWNQLIQCCDDSIFISADETLLKDRLIQRKIKGGLAPSAAENFYEQSDSRNVRRLLENHHKANINLVMLHDGNYEWVKKENNNE